MIIDRGLLVAVFFLIGLGLVQVYSSSFIFATEVHGDGLFFFRKQLLFAALGLASIGVTWALEWRVGYRLGVALWALAVVAVACTFVPGLGARVGGAHRWLRLPFGFRFEPGELLRVTYPFVLAPRLAEFAKGEVDARWWGRLIVALSPLALLNAQPDFGSLVIILSLVAALFVAFGLRWRLMIGGVALALPAMGALVVTSPYRLGRVRSFLNPWADPAEKGFQVIQSLLGFYSGGLTGVGLGQGQGKLFFLPEAHTDFTLAVLGEEMGFLGFVVLLLTYGFLVSRGFRVALRLKTYRERSIALSFALLIAFSVFINVGVALGLLPTKGLTLPLISYGGSSLVCTGLMIGWLLNLEQRSERALSFRDKETE